MRSATSSWSPSASTGASSNSWCRSASSGLAPHAALRRRAVRADHLRHGIPKRRPVNGRSLLLSGGKRAQSRNARAPGLDVPSRRELPVGEAHRISLEAIAGCSKTLVVVRWRTRRDCTRAAVRPVRSLLSPSVRGGRRRGVPPGNRRQPRSADAADARGRPRRRPRAHCGSSGSPASRSPTTTVSRRPSCAIGASSAPSVSTALTGCTALRALATGSTQGCRGAES